MSAQHSRQPSPDHPQKRHLIPAMPRPASTPTWPGEGRAVLLPKLGATAQRGQPPAWGGTAGKPCWGASSPRLPLRPGRSTGLLGALGLVCSGLTSVPPPTGAARRPVGVPGSPPLPLHGGLLPAHPFPPGQREQGAAALLVLPAQCARARLGGTGLSPMAGPGARPGPHLPAIRPQTSNPPFLPFSCEHPGHGSLPAPRTGQQGPLLPLGTNRTPEGSTTEPHPPPGPWTCRCDLGIAAQPGERKGKYKGGPRPGGDWEPPLSPLRPWTPPRTAPPPRTGSSPEGAEAAPAGGMVLVDARQVHPLPWQADLRACASCSRLFPGQAGVASGCMCPCVCDKFSNKGPALLLCGPPASVRLFAGMARGQPTRPFSPTQVGLPTHAGWRTETPRDTHGWWPAGSGCVCPSLRPHSPGPRACACQAWLPGSGWSPDSSPTVGLSPS